MKYLIALVCCYMLTSCLISADNIDSVFKLHDSYNSKTLKNPVKSMITIQYSRDINGYVGDFKNISIFVGVSKEGKIILLASWDEHFFSPEGCSINTTNYELINSYSAVLNEKIRYGYEMILPSGWKVYFSATEYPRDKPLPQNAKPSIIYKDDR